MFEAKRNRLEKEEATTGKRFKASKATYKHHSIFCMDGFVEMAARGGKIELKNVGKIQKI